MYYFILRQTMKISFIFLRTIMHIALITTLSMGLITNAPARQMIDGIVAIVNNSVVTHQELTAYASLVQKQLESLGNKVDVKQPVFLKEILERLIIDKIQLQRAKDLGINISEAEFNQILELTVKQSKLTVPTYMAQLEKSGINLKQWKQDQYNNIILARLRQKEVDTLVKVSESEIDSYLSSLTGVTVAPLEEFNISRIFIPYKNGLTKDGVDLEDLSKQRDKSRQILDDILAQKIAFTDAIRQYSKAPEVEQKQYDLIINDFSKLPSDVAGILLRMQRQQTWPELIETPEGFYILRLNDRRNNDQLREKAVQIPQTQVRQILVRVAGDMNEKEAKQHLTKIKQRIDAGESMASLASLYSQDGSAANNGNMGWVSLGEMVPEFEQAMNILQINQISQPIRTDYGYHLIQVLDRRIKSVGVNQQRETAKNVLLERKTEMVYQDWLRNLRERAFVDYRLNN